MTQTAGARYHRQRRLPEIGEEGQRRLASARVLVVGAGGLGSPAALYLAGAGVGQLGLIDDQQVELSNLHRQILHDAQDLGHSKVESAAARLARLNPEVTTEPIRAALGPDNIAGLLARYDIVVDGSDNFETKFLINDACVVLERAFVHGAVARWGGQLFTFAPGQPCLRCLFREPPPPGVVESCEEAGIVGPVAGAVGSLMATEVIKLVVGAGAPLWGRLLQLDALGGVVRETQFPRDPRCPVCGVAPVVRDWQHYAQAVTPRGHLAPLP
jgi:adenylyltransferase/sulfurtransferase